MKKFTLMLLAGIVAVTSFAQKPLAKAEMIAKEANELRQTQMQARGVSRSSLASRQKSPRKSLGLVTPPSEATPETYYTASGKLMVYTSNGFADGGRETIQVIVDGSDIYIAGLAYWLENAWIKGTIDGTTATFPAAQQVDYDESYPEWISGSDDGQTICDVVFNFDQEAGVLECITTYIGECAYEDDFQIYAYWMQPTFTKDQPAGPEVVVLPDGLEILPYAMSYDEGSKGINVAVDGNDVYFQGMSNYCPEAWVKGTKDGNLVTFPAMQYMGDYVNYGSSFFFYNGEATFTYDPDAGTYTAEGLVYGALADQYYDGKYTNPVLTPVVEKAVMPANPEITGMEEDNYGWIVEFNIPLTDVNGDPLAIGKLSYMIYTDTEGTIAPLTFTPATHSKLTEDMTEIPFGFSDNYDFYADEIYLNDLYSADWTRIGIQSIYRGGGEENKTEIQWFDILPEPEAIEAPEGLETETYVFSAQSLENGDEEWEDYTYQTQVGFDGNDVYFKGISNDTADMWLKGKLSEDGKTVTIPASQYMGRLTFWDYTFDYFITAKDEENNMIDVVLNYDAESSTFTTDQTVVLNGSKSNWEPYQTFTSVKITKMPEFAATPAYPSIDSYKLENTNYPYIEFNIPAKDIDDNDIISAKLFYTVWIEKDGEEKPFVVLADEYKYVEEDWTEIPYDWDDQYDIYRGGSRFYINPTDIIPSWKRIGIQSIYYGAGERNTSNIIWMDNPVYEPAKELYTEFVEETGTLTYYYDNKKNSRSGVTEVYDPVGNPDAVRFAEYYYDVTKAVIDPSMKDAELTSMKNMFYGGFDSETYNKYYLNYMTEIEGLENLNTSEVTDMKEMFYSCQELTSLDLSTFDTRKVTNMEGMFENCTRLKMLDISSFDVSNVTSFMLMFSQCTHLKTICCFGDWSSSSAQSGYMFYGCYALYGSEGTAYTEAVTDKTYARPDGGTGAPGYFTADTMTSIASPLGETEEGAIYNVAGQRLNKPVKGVNIIDGKKIVK